MNKYEELSKLKELLDAGVLSKEEFEAEKKKILDASEEVKPASTKKSGFFSKEAARQRQEAFERLPKAEQQRNRLWVWESEYSLQFLLACKCSLLCCLVGVA